MNIAISGGIGAGKSTIIHNLVDYFPAAKFYSMDDFVAELYTEPVWLEWVKSKFRTTDRKEISNLVFGNPILLNELNSQSALKIGVKLGKVLGNGGLNIVEFPLLFETRSQDLFDQAVLITADQDVRLKRAYARGHKTVDQIMQVMNSQMPEATKKTMASIIIDTSHDDVDTSIMKLVHQLNEKVIK